MAGHPAVAAILLLLLLASHALASCTNFHFDKTFQESTRQAGSIRVSHIVQCSATSAGGDADPSHQCPRSECLARQQPNATVAASPFIVRHADFALGRLTQLPAAEQDALFALVRSAVDEPQVAIPSFGRRLCGPLEMQGADSHRCFGGPAGAGNYLAFFPIFVCVQGSFGGCGGGSGVRNGEPVRLCSPYVARGHRRPAGYVAPHEPIENYNGSSAGRELPNISCVNPAKYESSKSSASRVSLPLGIVMLIPWALGVVYMAF